MNGILERSAVDPCFDAARLRTQPLGELWRAWRQVGHALLARAWDEVQVWRGRARTRRMMNLMTGHEFKDMGLTRQQAAFEMNKPFWRE